MIRVLLLVLISGCCWHDRFTRIEHQGNQKDLRTSWCVECGDTTRETVPCRHTPNEIMPWWPK